MAEQLKRIEVIVADITTLAVDAIVNAANTSLLGGGGVDGAIHRAAGPGLLAECRSLNGCETGQAKMTGGYNLPAKYVIHTVGPVWWDGQSNEDDLLASCYDECFTLMNSYDIKTIAFPAISTGVYRFPKDRAASIAVGRTINWVKRNDESRRVTFCCFSAVDAAVYHAVISESASA